MVTVTDGTNLKRARSGLKQHAGGFGGMAGGGDHGGHVEGRAGPQNGADIMWIGHLVQYNHNAFARNLVEPRLAQGLCFQHQSLVHGILRFEQMVKQAGMNDLGLDRKGTHILRQSGGTIFRGPQPDVLSLAIAQGGGHGMHAVNQIVLRIGNETLFTFLRGRRRPLVWLFERAWLAAKGLFIWRLHVSCIADPIAFATVLPC